MDPATISLLAGSWKAAGAFGGLVVLLLLFAAAVLRWLATRIEQAEARALTREQTNREEARQRETDLVARVRALEDRQHRDLTVLATQLVAALERSSKALERNAEAFERWAEQGSGPHRAIRGG